GTVTTFSGNTLPIRARSILVHSDTPGSLALATLVRSEIEACGATVASAAEVLAQ
ncbi:LamB/YcsF family protein, partial [Acinetobacter baumannii]|nr:LamB/YcsF family protein [Acinetobacter baumannii]